MCQGTSNQKLTREGKIRNVNQMNQRGGKRGGGIKKIQNNKYIKSKVKGIVGSTPFCI